MPKEIFGRDFPFIPTDHLLSFDEIERLAAIFVELGVKKIRVTGGEPLLRRDYICVTLEIIQAGWFTGFMFNNEWCLSLFKG